MIIKKQDVTGTTLGFLVAYLESRDNQLPHEFGGTRRKVVRLKSLNLSADGTYAVDLEMYEGDEESRAKRPVDSEYLIRVYDILVGN